MARRINQSRTGDSPESERNREESMRQRRNELEQRNLSSRPGMGEPGRSSGPMDEASRRLERASGQARQKAENIAEGAKTKARGMGEKLKGRAGEIAETRKGQVAGGIDRVSDRIDQRASSLETRGGLKGKAGQAAHRASDALEGSADYLRTHQIGTIRDDVQGQIRSHPFLTVGAAVGTGFVLGRIFGGDEEEVREEERERYQKQLRSRGHEPHEQHGLWGQLRDQARGPLGRAVMSSVGGMVAGKVRDRVGGQPRSSQRSSGMREC